MKIVFFTDLFLPHIDGVTTSLLNLCRGLQNKGHQVLVVAPKPATRFPIKLTDINLAWLPSVSAAIYPELRLGLLSPNKLAEIRNFRPDIVHLMTPGTVGGLGFLFSRIMGIPSVTTFHGYFMGPELLGSVGIKKGTKQIGKILWQAAKLFYQNCDVVISPSTFVMKDLKNRGLQANIRVCRHSLVKPEKTDKNKQLALKQKYQLGDQVGLYVGRLSKEKNLDTLIYVWNRIIRDLPEAQLLIVGGGPEEEHLKQIVADLDLQQKVIFTGEIPYKKLMSLGIYELAQVYLSSSATEVQPMSMIEAVCFGLPVVALKVDGMEELVSNNGLLISQNDRHRFADAVKTMLSDTELQKKMAQYSLQVAREFSGSHVVNAHIDIYKNLCSKD